MSNYFGAVDNVVLEDYNPEYPALFKKEKERLIHLLGDNIVRIDHVGSTAIPYIKSKPVIDMVVMVDEFPISEQRIKALQSDSYIYWEHNPDPTHQFFFKGLPRTHILHIHPPGHKKAQDQVAFRDYLLQHPAKAKEYENLKIDLAGRFYNDREKYTDMKTGFVRLVLELAGRE